MIVFAGIGVLTVILAVAVGISAICRSYRVVHIKFTDDQGDE